MARSGPPPEERESCQRSVKFAFGGLPQRQDRTLAWPAAARSSPAKNPLRPAASPRAAWRARLRPVTGHRSMSARRRAISVSRGDRSSSAKYPSRAGSRSLSASAVSALSARRASSSSRMVCGASVAKTRSQAIRKPEVFGSRWLQRKSPCPGLAPPADGVVSRDGSRCIDESTSGLPARALGRRPTTRQGAQRRRERRRAETNRARPANDPSRIPFAGRPQEIERSARVPEQIPIDRPARDSGEGDRGTLGPEDAAHPGRQRATAWSRFTASERRSSAPCDAETGPPPREVDRERQPHQRNGEPLDLRESQGERPSSSRPKPPLGHRQPQRYS